MIRDRLPERIASRNPYPTRSQNSYTTYRCKTVSYYKSYFPATVRDWNSLPDPIKTISDYNVFKDKLYKLNAKSPPPQWYYVGKRSANIILCRLRNGCSSLNDDLFNNFISNSSRCSCGASVESAAHFFLACTLYNI